MVYDLLYRHQQDICWDDDQVTALRRETLWLYKAIFPFKDSMSFLRTCRQVNNEASAVLYGHNVFNTVYFDSYFRFLPFVMGVGCQPLRHVRSIRKVKINLCRRWMAKWCTSEFTTDQIQTNINRIWNVGKWRARKLVEYLLEGLYDICSDPEFPLEVLELYMKSSPERMTLMKREMQKFLSIFAEVGRAMDNNTHFLGRRANAFGLLQDLPVLESVEDGTVSVRLSKDILKGLANAE